MLCRRLQDRENVILARSKIAGNTGHPVHKGTPREIFIREFLNSHLSERVAIGSGESVDCHSLPNQHRNQIDIVIYRRDFPKLEFSKEIHGFLAESVVATIEVKSNLTKAELESSIRTARAVKPLDQSVHSTYSFGYRAPDILSYVVAYDGPARMETVHGWIAPLHKGTTSPTHPCRGPRIPLPRWRVPATRD